MRTEFGKTILELAEKDKKLILLSGDYESGLADLKKRFPLQYINLGICEQAIVGIAAGMALEGFRPVVYSATPFVLERPFEMVKICIDQQKAPVILVGYEHLDLGPTHIPLDLEIMAKLFSNIKFYLPKNSEETRKALIDAYEKGGPAFIGLKKDPASKY